MALGAAQAEEATISAVSAFADGTTFTKNFERFIAKVNETGKGVVQIDYKGGGGKVMNPFQLGDAIRTGVVGIGNLPGAFYTKLMPEADAFKLSAFTITEERANGAWEYTNELHKKRNERLPPGAPEGLRSVPPLSQQEDRGPRPLGPQAPGDADLPRLLLRHGRLDDPAPSRATSIPRSSAARSTATAGRPRACSIWAGTR